MPFRSDSPRQSRYLIRPAAWPLDEAAASLLLHGYAAYLASGPNGTDHIDASGLLDELAWLPEVYADPDAVLLLAWDGETAAGCVAVKRFHARKDAWEMKRLWTNPAFRGTGLGRLLAEAAVAWARGRNAHLLLLDTQPQAMPEAAALYRSLGFTETVRYNDNPVPGLLFMELRLGEEENGVRIE